ncbi:MAG: Tyrosine-specific transport protein [Chlamydiae bacterium]|nr:Tyrosine-specific transport protein [Chlamydiota bacterium]
MNSSQSSSRVTGSILMVAGCCIGAGMLGVPVISSLAGFIPSTLMFVLSWLFMMTTGLLLLEVNLWFEEEVSIVSMVGLTLGKVGRILSWVLFGYLFYSLMIAYVAGSGLLLAGLADDVGLILPNWVGSTAFTLLFSIFVFLGTGFVDWFNRLLMAGLIISYVLLVSLGIRYVEPEFLLYQDWSATLLVIPAMIISFGFHNLVPSLTTYMERDRKKLFWIFFLGSLLPLLIYLVWGGLIMGIVPISAFQSAMESGDLVTVALKNTVNSPLVLLFAEHFAFFAIVSSFITVALSFVDFLADGLHVKKDRKGRLFLTFLTLFPPFLCAMIYPGIFLVAISYAGVFGALILFGIFPALMVWRGRYFMKIDARKIVPGGRVTLSLIIVFAVLVIFVNIALDLHLLELN